MIKFYCGHCGKKMGAPDNYAGKRVRCPQCKNPAVVREPEPVEMAEIIEDDSEQPTDPQDQRWSDEEYGDQDQLLENDYAEDPNAQQSKSCPDCGTDSIPDAVLCVHCGYNFQTGKKVRVKKEKPRALYNEDTSTNKNQKKRIGVILGSVAGMVFITIMIWGFISAKRGTMLLSGLGFGWFVCAIGWIWFLIVAFKENAIWGVVCVVFPIVGIAFFFLHMRETWKPILLQILGGGIIIGVAISAISNIEGLIESAWELTEEDIQEYINDDDYMFMVACWVVDQQGRWDEYDNQYDGEFAGLLTSYRGGWMKPPTRRAELVKKEIQFVEEIVSNWTQQQKREQVIAHNEFQKAEYDQESDDDNME